MSTLEKQKEILKIKIISMKLKKTQYRLVPDLTSLVQYRDIIGRDIEIAKRDLREARGSDFKDEPEVVRQMGELEPLIEEVERLYKQKRSAVPA